MEASLKDIFNRAVALATAFILTLTLSSCGKGKSEQSHTDSVFSSPEQNNADRYSFVYPEKPAEKLRDALKSAITERSLPIDVGEVKQITFEGMEQAEIILRFTESDDNICNITFDLKHAASGFDYSLDGHDSPSFVMAFKDPGRTQDMLVVLALVLQYISPGLNDEEARRLAENQDSTISIDGYSQPLDIDGYQVVSRYTNPHVFARTQEFESSLGVEVTAIKQIWGEMNPSEFGELKSQSDYIVLTSGYAPQEKDDQVKEVYADFVIKNVWHHDDWVHGDYWAEVDVESMDGNRYTLRVETMRMIMNYEFGIGQRYTLHITTGSCYGAVIVYAIQRSSVLTPNSRGVPQALDYPEPDMDNLKYRIEPDGIGTIYDVRFFLISQGIIGDVYAALEGHGVGEEQWPHDPSRDGYAFVGWFDNKEGTGTPYTKDTPIYQNTNLYTKWKYIGGGGVWPREHKGEIQGVKEGSTLSIGKKLTITASGYNMNLNAPQDQRFRWKPIAWRLSDGPRGSFTSEAPFAATLLLDNAGEQELFITYSEEIYDGICWQETGQSNETQEVTFLVQ